MDVRIVGVDENNRMSDGVGLIFVDPRVEGRHVNVLDLFVWVSSVMQFDGIRATSEEGIPGLEWVDDFQGVEELA